MGVTMKKLTARRVEAAKPGKHEDGAGLRLVVSTAGSRSWIFRFTFKGNRREMGLGPYPVVSLAEARQLAADARRLCFDGIDPIQARQAEKTQQETPTFLSSVAAYMRQHRHGWKNHQDKKRWVSAIRRYAIPHLGSMRVDVIETADVLTVLQPIWTTKNRTAKTLQGRIEIVLDSASAQGHRQQFNPARWKGHLDKILPKPSKVSQTRHQAAMPFRDVAEFVSRLRSDGNVTAKALEFVILTACRSDDARVAVWSQIDLVEQVWTIPASTMKTAREFRIPLSSAAISLLNELPRFAGNDYLFPGRLHSKPIGKSSMLVQLNDLGESYTVHGFRSTFRDWAGETTNSANHIVEMALGHAISNQVEAAYRRGDLFEKRRLLMESWAVYCSASGQVVPFSRDSVSTD